MGFAKCVLLVILCDTLQLETILESKTESGTLSQRMIPQDRVSIWKTVLEEYPLELHPALYGMPRDTACTSGFLPVSERSTSTPRVSFLTPPYQWEAARLLGEGQTGLTHCHSNCLQWKLALWLVRKWPRTETYPLHSFSERREITVGPSWGDCASIPLHGFCEQPPRPSSCSSSVSSSCCLACR